jgi:branched-chain amino acid transport system substrate-binding protein
MLGRALGLATAIGIAVACGKPAGAQDWPGVTATELRIGNTVPYSGPASAYGAVGRSDAAFFQMINQSGGIGGRKIKFITADDGYSPPKTVEQTRRLVEDEQVAFLFNGLGTPTSTAVARYLNQKKVPQLFIYSGADKWGDYRKTPWTMAWPPSYRTEAQIYAKYVLEHKPDARIAILYQNDDFGKDYVAGVKDVLGTQHAGMLVQAISYEVTDPTIDQQIVSMQSSGADVLITAATPKFAAQTIRKVYDIGWKPLQFMTNVSISVGSVLGPAGPEKAAGMISAAFLKDPTDPAWKDDPGMQEWRGFMAKYLPGADLTDGNFVFGYGVSKTLMQVLQQCGADLSRENIMKQAANLHDLDLPVLLPGIRINTSPTNYHPIRQMQLERWTGKTWERFGSVIEGSGW